MNNQHLARYKNPILLKDQEGKSKPTIYDLPPQEHTYGKKIVDDPEPIKSVVNGWKDAQQSANPPSAAKNYAQLNKQAIKNNIHTAKQQTDFRSTREIMVEKKKGQKVIPIMLPEEEFVYGIPNRPSTPVKLVVGNCYALEAQRAKGQLYFNETQKIEAQNSSKLQAKKTKSQALRQQKAKQEKAYLNKPNIEQRFKLSKFTQQNITKIDSGLKSLVQKTGQVTKQ